MEKTSPGINAGGDGTGERISEQFDWNETPPSVAVVRLLGVALNCDPTAIEPLGETVDPDALDRLLLSMDAGSQLQFTHRRLSVLLDGDGTATVEPESR